MGISLVVASRGYSLVARYRLLSVWASAVAACGLSSLALEHRLISYAQA